MNRILIWDLPVRLFHALLVLGFFAAISIALLADEHGSLFPFHAMIGIVLTILLALRIIWGCIGTRYARFSSFAYPPTAVVAYLQDLFRPAAKTHIGHNPASAFAIYLMFMLLATMAFTGFLLARGNHAAKEIHEIAAYMLLAVAAIHILGVIIHAARHRDRILAAMITGKKMAEPAAAISSSKPVTATIGILLVIVSSWALYRNFDPATRVLRLPLLQTSLQLGEPENEIDDDSGDSGHDHARH